MANWQFPEGKSIAAVTSWDDGPKTDNITRRMLDQYGWMGTFYMQPERVGAEGHLDREALCRLTESGHEIGLLAAASLDAPRLARDRASLESLAGQPVATLAYPDAFSDRAAAEAARAAGFRSGRVGQQGVVTLETEPLLLPVTGRGDESLNDLRDRWDALEEEGGGVFHLWGHTASLGEDPHDWLDLECLLGFFGGISHVWYCTVSALAAELAKQRQA